MVDVITAALRQKSLQILICRLLNLHIVSLLREQPADFVRRSPLRRAKAE
jgi:hypothetical protein